MLAETFVNKSHNRHLKLSNARISMSPPKCRSEKILQCNLSQCPKTDDDDAQDRTTGGTAFHVSAAVTLSSPSRVCRFRSSHLELECGLRTDEACDKGAHFLNVVRARLPHCCRHCSQARTESRLSCIKAFRVSLSSLPETEMPTQNYLHITN